MLHNLQHRSLYRIQQLTTDHNVRHCTCISEVDPDLSIKGAILFQKHLQDMVKRKMTKTKLEMFW
jgi:hypothetical protein